MVLSEDPEAKLPFFNVAKELILFVWPMSLKTKEELEGFHIIEVLSIEADAIFPLGSNANE